MTSLGSLSFADGGISGYERTGDSVHMVVRAFTSEYQPTSFTVTFQGVTDVLYADRWDEKIASERLSEDGGLKMLTLLDRAGGVMFAITFDRMSIAESTHVPTVETLNIVWPRGTGTAELTNAKRDYVYWVGTTLIILTMGLLAIWTVFRW